MSEPTTEIEETEAPVSKKRQVAAAVVPAVASVALGLAAQILIAKVVDLIHDRIADKNEETE